MSATVLKFPGYHVRPADPRNGEVYACESVAWSEVDGVEINTPDGFIVVHMSSGGGSAFIDHGYTTLEEAEIAARARAQQRGAVYVGGAA